MTFNIFNPSVQTILRLMEESTAHLYYAAELRNVAGLSKPTVINVMGALHEAGFVHKKQEQVAEDTNRGARNHYTLTPFGLSACRLTPPST